MIVEPGARIGTYDVTAKLGEGGMGEVWRATDRALDRQVAIKILPDALAADPERLARFEREAKTLASLNHPHIATIYGFEKSSGAYALVMELVEGEDLSERIARGAMPVDEALPLARQIAEALEAAHEQGIIHRDLKPANIKVRADGTVKVLDFGLAKAIEGASGSGRTRGASQHEAAQSPTITSPAVTAAGMILGTAAYMAPEQARGKPADKRADVWAFGVVLYEMLAGRRTFAGPEVSDVLAAVLRQEIDWTALPADTPAAVRRLLRRCLEKDRAERLGDMSTARLEIKEAMAAPIAEAGERTGAARPTLRTWQRVSAALALVAVALAASLALRWTTRPAAPADDEAVVRFALVDDSNLRIITGTTTPFAASRDGRSIVFTAVSTAGVHLWVRTLDQAEPRWLAATAGGHQPAISPDGNWIAYVVANHVIRKVRFDGSGTATVASLDDTTAALAWASDDRILFERIGSESGIHQVSANGGTPEPLIPLESNEQGHRRPFVVREAGVVLYASATADGRTTLAAFSLADGRRSRLDVDGVQALGVIDGHLVYARSDGSLRAVPFDARAMRVLGDPVALDDRVASGRTGVSVTLSESGTLVLTSAVSPLSRLMLGDETGRAAPMGDWVRAFVAPRFSPDERRIAVGIVEGDGQDLWLVDRASAEGTRVTRGQAQLRLEDWTPDGKALVYVRGGQVWSAPVDGSAEPRQLVESSGRVLGASLLPDGRGLVLSRRIDSGQGALDREELVRVPIEGGATVVPIIASRSAGGMVGAVDPRVSPDGRWVAFQDRNEQQVHVRSIDGVTGVQISDAGGELPVWGADSRRVFYQTAAGLMAADLQFSPQLTVVRRLRLPAFPVVGTVQDVSNDGQTFLILAPIDPAPRVLVTTNWASTVRRLLRTADRQP